MWSNMSSDLVSKQFPVSDRQLLHMDHISHKPDSSVSEIKMIPVSSGPMSPVESVPGNGNRTGGQMEYRTGGQSSSSLPGSAPQQLLSNQQGINGNVPTAIGVQKLSVPNKRKAEGGPVLHASSPRQSSLVNKRAGDTGSFSHSSGRPQYSSMNKKTEQVQPKVSPTASQALPASSRKVVRNESFSSKTGPQRPQGPKGQAIQADTMSKNQTDSFKAVRSKMRESLAGALALVCQRKDETANTAKDTDELSIGFPLNETLQVSGTSFNDIQCITELGVEDIPFSDNFFVKDDLLQGNGLSWVMDLDMAAREMNQLEAQTKASPEDLAFKIEAELFKLFGGVNKKYKEKGRSLLFNLKDPNNPELRERVMSGEILPERLCSMTAEELASKELSEWRTAKAEELAQMVVLPSNDGDMRRLVKKTHKGEYQVEFESDDIAAEISAGSTSITQFQPKSKKSSAKKQDLPDSLVIPTDGTDLMQGMMVDEFKEADFLPPIVTLDEFMESLDSEPPFENMPVDATQTPLSDKEERTTEGPSNASEGKPSEVGVKSISTPAAKKESPSGNASVVGSIWEGALQLSLSTSVTVVCYLRSGETTSAKEWPNSLEVKGRVRLDAFEKFIQQLPMSRSRAVMVVQFVLKDKSSEDGRRSLSEAVDSYVSDNRLGFAEPAPGVELYLCPPHGRALDMLTKHFSKDSQELHDSTDSALVGVVVWRKHHITSTISPDSTHHKHTFKKQPPVSSRPQETDNVNLLPKVSAPLKPPDDEEDDDDVPPGFGPPKGGGGGSRDDDDLPEFNFSGNMNASSLPGGYPHPRPRTPTPLPVDQMRQLVHKYGQTDNNNTMPGGFGIEPWNDDDDDDIPEWQPHAPVPPPNLRPPGPSGFHHHPLQHPHLGHPIMQTPHHVPNLSPRWPQGGQYYGLRPGQPPPGPDYRRDSSSSRRF